MQALLKRAPGAVALFLCVLAYADTVAIPVNIAQREPINVASAHLTATADILSVDTAIDDGTTIGAIGHGYFCSDPEILTYYKKDGYLISLRSARSLYAKAIAAVGYPAYERWVSAFEGKYASDPDFAVSIKILDVKFKRCAYADPVVRRVDVFGNGYVKVEWKLTYAPTQSVVYSKAVEASLVVKDDERMRFEDMEDAVFSRLIANVLGDPDYVAAFKNPVALPDAAPASPKGVGLAKP